MNPVITSNLICGTQIITTHILQPPGLEVDTALIFLLILGEDRSSTSMAQEFRPADGEVIGAFPCNPSMIFNPSNGQK